MPYYSYALTGGKIPRQTLYSKKQAAKKALVLLAQQQRLLHSNGNETRESSNSKTDHPHEPGNNIDDRTCVLNLKTQINHKEGDQSQETFSAVGKETTVCVADSSEEESAQIFNDHEELRTVPNDSLSECDSDTNAETQEINSQATANDELHCHSRSTFNINVEPEENGGCSSKTAKSGYCFLQGGKKMLQERICKCVETSVGDIVFMCLTLGLRHNLTWAAQLDILRMFQIIFGPHTLPKTKESYFNVLDVAGHEMAFHTFCPKCLIYIGKRDDKKGIKKCCNESCNETIDISKPSTFFLSLSLEAQFKLLLTDPEVAKLIMQHRFTRVKEDKDALEDIYDGEEYQKHFRNGGILSLPHNFSYSFFIDGVSTGKSTCKTMWPVYVVINELPYKERSKRMMLAGLYVGQNDPNQSVFLKPFVEEAIKLSLTGFSTTLEGNSFISKAIPLCAVMDSVARCQVLDMQSYHAYWGCTFCYQEQKHLGGRHKRFDILSTKAEDRTAESTYCDAVEAYKLKDIPLPLGEERHYRGVKGLSILSKLPFFNLIWGCTIDYLHAFLLGLMRTHMEYLFDSRRKYCWEGMQDPKVGVEHIMKSIDDRLLTIKPPTSITRIPRSISKLKNWKASEWRSWLLFYCIPCMEGLLKDKYLYHLALLSKGTFLLLQKSIKKAQVYEAHQYFIKYAYYFQVYFDPQTTLYNIHILTHVCKCVLMWGPLWTHDAFPFEGQNRHLLQLLKSPSNVVLQVARKHLVYMSIPILCNKMVSSVSTLDFAENLLCKRLSHFVRCGPCVLAGKGKNYVLTGNEERCLSSTEFSSSQCLFFQRVLYRGMRFATSDYCCSKNNDNSYVCLTNEKMFCIKYIVLLPSQRVVLMGKKVRCFKRHIINTDDVVLSHIRKVKRIGINVSLFNPSEMHGQCVVMNIEGGTFISNMPIGCYGD